MRVKEISIVVGYTVNTGNFESTKVQVGQTAEIGEFEQDTLDFLKSDLQWKTMEWLADATKQILKTKGAK